jgi:hypothetical protein
MTAAFTHRNVVFDADSGYPGVLSPVAHVGSPPPRRKPSTVFEGLVPYVYSIHLRHRQFPDPPVQARPLRGAGVWTFTSARIMPGNQGERAGELCPGGTRASAAGDASVADEGDDPEATSVGPGNGAL